MDDPLLVRRFERLGDLLRDRQRLVDAESLRARCAVTDPRRSTSSITSARTSSGFFEAVNRGDVRVIERRERLRFAL